MSSFSPTFIPFQHFYNVSSTFQDYHDFPAPQLHSTTNTPIEQYKYHDILANNTTITMADESPTTNSNNTPAAEMEYQQPNLPRQHSGGYPYFHNGDVLIVSPTGRSWKLHSLILAKAAPGFEAVFNSFDPVHVSKKAKEEGRTVKWKLEMINEPEAVGQDPEGLKYKQFRPMVSHDFLQNPNSAICCDLCKYVVFEYVIAHVLSLSPFVCYLSFVPSTYLNLKQTLDAMVLKDLSGQRFLLLFSTAQLIRGFPQS